MERAQGFVEERPGQLVRLPPQPPTADSKGSAVLLFPAENSALGPASTAQLGRPLCSLDALLLLLVGRLAEERSTDAAARAVRARRHVEALHDLALALRTGAVGVF